MGNLSFQLDEKLSKEIAEQAKSKNTTEQEIIKRAIATYQALNKEIEDHNRIIVVKDDKNDKKTTFVKEITVS
jgi:hypothetical protein